MSTPNGCRTHLAWFEVEAAAEMFATGKLDTADIARLMGATEACVYNSIHRHREAKKARAA
jgi:hypothetical protein